MLTFDFYLGITLCEPLLRNADNLSATLQTKDMSAAEGKYVSMKTVKTVFTMRSDVFRLFWQTTMEKSPKTRQ